MSCTINSPTVGGLTSTSSVSQLVDADDALTARLYAHTIYSFPVYYISFDPKPELEDQIRERGWKNVHHFPAVPGKSKTALEWYQEGLLSLRSYVNMKQNNYYSTDLLPSLGAIGCYLSHLNIWKIAIQQAHPYVIVMEEDILLNRNLYESELLKIAEILNQPKSVYLSAPSIHPVLGHFYIARLDACKVMVEHALPIEIQVDVYIDFLSIAGLISKTVFLTYSQKFHISTIQKFCLKCIFPSNNGQLFLLIVLICLIVIVTLKYIKII